MVVAGDEDSKHISGVTLQVKGDEEIDLSGFKVRVLQVPCHTRGHVLYYFDANKQDTYPVDIEHQKRETDESK